MISRMRGIITIALSFLLLFPIAFPISASNQEIDLTNSSKPRHLYVVDYELGADHGNIHMIDMDSGDIVNTFKTDTKPQIALSPDGSKLYVVSLKWGNNKPHDILYVINTDTFDVEEEVEIQDRLLTNVFAPTLSVSPDGKKLIVPKLKSEGDKHDYWLSIMDTDNLDTELGRVTIPDAGVPKLHFYNEKILYVMDKNSTVYKVDVEELAVEKEFVLPDHPKRLDEPGEVVAVALNQDRHLILVRDTGEWMKLSNKGKINKTVKSKNKNMETILGAAASSLSSNALFIGVAEPKKRAEGKIEELWVFDLDTGEFVRTIKNLGEPMDFNVSRDGNYLYTIDSAEKKITVFNIRDSYNIEKVSTIENVGDYPVWVVSD